MQALIVVFGEGADLRAKKSCAFSYFSRIVSVQYTVLSRCRIEQDLSNSVHSNFELKTKPRKQKSIYLYR